MNERRFHALRSRLRPAVLCLLATLACCAVSQADETLTIRHMPPDTSFDQRDAYALALLQLALDRTVHDHGPARLQQAPFRVSQARAARLIRDGDYLDILWVMSSQQRESVLRPVRIPLMRGLMGARVLVVRRDRQGQMSGVDTLRDLQQHPLAQGHDWPDTAILRANGLRVQTSSDFHSLFRMLARERVDAVPRSITEIRAERSIYDRLELTIEPQLLLLYRAPSYFFVSPDRPDLHQRISTGLERAIADGGFEELFLNHAAIKPALTRLAEKDLRVIKLGNPDLGRETPLEREELWYQPLFGDPQVGPSTKQNQGFPR